MKLAEELGKASVMFAMTLRYLLSTRRGIATAALAAVPLLLAGSLAVARVETFDILLFQILMVPLFLQVVLIFVTLVSATALIREEIEDNTLPYLLTRPVSKPAIALYKYTGYLVVGLLFGFLWESVVGSIPGDVPRLSIIHYLRSILKDMIDVGPLAGYPTDVSAAAAAAILIAFTVAALILTMVAFQQSEFKQKA